MRRLTYLGLVLLLYPSLAAAEPPPERGKIIWFLQDGGARSGPFDTARVQALIRTGRVSREVMVWRLSMDGWAPASSVEVFVQAREEYSPPREVPRRLLFMIGAGFSFGFFNPRGVNDYLTHSIGPRLYLESGSLNMSVNMVPRLSVVFAPIEYIEVEALAELGWSPKTLREDLSGFQMTFDFMRYSAGGTIRGVLPIFRYRAALLAGAGVLYHRMTIEGYAASTAGFRANVALRLYPLEPAVLEISAFFDYAKATDPLAGPVPDAMPVKPSGPLTLDYTGGGIGLTAYFEMLSR